LLIIKKRMLKQIIFNKICKDIKSLKIQSATTLARKAFYSYKLIPTQDSKKKLLGLRPTEPMLYNLLNKYKDYSYEDISKILENSQERINEEIFKIIKNGDIVFTHCHATSVINALIYAKKKGKHFEVFNTETRPLYQGRKTSKELRRVGIKVTMFVDAAALIALANNSNKKADLILLGADVITKKGVMNKIGSAMYAELAKLHKIPFYIVTNSLKFTKKEIKIEQRKSEEVWDNKKSKVKIINPAFEFIQKNLIKGIISEYGILKYDDFLKKVKEN
jgi:translation initiation factor 2B subunit (eIF-2B alpha/beta/delta family)